jgi:hypothetical protein
LGIAPDKISTTKMDFGLFNIEILQVHTIFHNTGGFCTDSSKLCHVKSFFYHWQNLKRFLSSVDVGITFFWSCMGATTSPCIEKVFNLNRKSNIDSFPKIVLCSVLSNRLDVDTRSSMINSRCDPGCNFRLKLLENGHQTAR